MQAVHLGTQYLVHDSFTNSTYGQVLLLKHVCWLDINATFPVSALFHHPLCKVFCCAVDVTAYTRFLMQIVLYVCRLCCQDITRLSGG